MDLNGNDTHVGGHRLGFRGPRFFQHIDPGLHKLTEISKPCGKRSVKCSMTLSKQTPFKVLGGAV